MYKKVLWETIKRENDRYFIDITERTIGMWGLINREIGNATQNEKKLEFRIGNKLSSKPTEIADKQNTHFM